MLEFQNSLGRRSLLLVILLLVTIVAGCAGSQQQGGTGAGPATIKIGVTYPLSGGLAESGLDAQHAAQLAAEIINGKYPDIKLPFAATEGLPNKSGAKLELVFADNKGSAETGTSEAERLITSEKVVALYGGFSSAVTSTASQVAERAGIPYLNDISSSPTLTSRGFKWFFSITPDDADFAAMFFTFLNQMKAEGKKIDNVGIVYENSSYGAAASKAERENAAKNNYKVTSDLGYPSGTTNLTTEVLKLKAANPDVLIANSYINEAVLYMRTLKEMNYAPPCILAQDSGYIEAQFTQMLGADGDYILSREVFSPDLAKVNPSIKSANDLFKEKYGINLNANSSRAFQGVFVLADALNRAASLKPEDIRQALLATDIKSQDLMMPWEGVKFNEKQKNTFGRGIIVQLQAGKYVSVWPVASAELIWPFPAWDKRK